MNKNGNVMEFDALKAYLSQPFQGLGDMSYRLHNAMLNLNLSVVAHIYAYQPEQFLKTDRVGRGTLNELEGLLVKAGVPWGALQFRQPEHILSMDAQQLQRDLALNDLILLDDIRPMDNDTQFLIHFLPEDARNGLSGAFLASVMGDPVVRRSVQAVLIEAIKARLDRRPA